MHSFIPSVLAARNLPLSGGLFLVLERFGVGVKEPLQDHPDGIRSGEPVVPPCVLIELRQQLIGHGNLYVGTSHTGMIDKPGGIVKIYSK